jgi:hypothetical protein
MLTFFRWAQIQGTWAYNKADVGIPACRQRVSVSYRIHTAGLVLAGGKCRFLSVSVRVVLP